MLKKILNKIQKFESQKQLKQDKISEIKNEIADIDSKLKRLYTFKKEYEKLESDSTEFLNNLK
jgi:archaellum component FlaC